ncbi:MAG: 30S ribosomal protein S6 [Ardenticatenaceae bacterium]|nr:30S ribosomal protein S6 [Anaerolineales bacterium]MCB8940962.1 30S ribosomal protein S6 [Ardenticatenaceae bacterium]MCB8972301.1 30S ribosomal protein S6 [Ardenticatenaceae bacterium]
MREYEVTVIFQTKLDDEARAALVGRVSDWLTQGETDADKPVQNVWGQRRLAYPIKKNSEGYYILFDAKLNPESLSDIERNMQYTDDILRYMFVRKEQ